MKSCPNCQEPLKTDAIVCTHCGHQFARIPATAPDGSRPTADRKKIGCAILILSLVALVLWASSSRYLEQSPEGAEAVKAEPSAGDREKAAQGR